MSTSPSDAPRAPTAYVSSPRPGETDRLTSAELREAFLLDGLFEGAGGARFTDLDRLYVAAFVPASAPIVLADAKQTGRSFFHERRESGAINLGGAGAIEVDGVRHTIGRFDGLYVGMGARSVRFVSDDPAAPAQFFFLSCPAHQAFPTTRITRDACNVLSLGTQPAANVRKIYQYIHEGGVKSCQLVMGFTELAEGSVWNTFPPHTHTRRSEIYCYFDLQGPLVMHFMGEPTRTRHLVVREKGVVLSPPWSIHSGCGAGAYRFVWGMAGENQAFADMDACDLNELR